MLAIALNISTVCIVAAMLISTWRLIVGPAAPDRVLAFDTLYLYAIGLAVLSGIRHESTVYFEAALLIALLGFIATVALARYLVRGAVVE